MATIIITTPGQTITRSLSITRKAVPVLPEAKPFLAVDSHQRDQTFMGFGGAFTEAASSVFWQAPRRVRQQMLKAYFDPRQGLGYGLGRLSIHSCDFSLDSYIYVSDEDPSLRSFDIAREDRFVIPLLKEAADTAGRPLFLLASPWSPPAFMKTNREMAHGGKLLPGFRSLWADYVAFYVKAMGDRGIRIDAVTVQNEPDAVQRWESCIWTGEEEGEFIADELYPALCRIGRPDMKILAWDHNRDIFPARAKATMGITRAIPHLWGFAYHWYCSEAFANVTEVHHTYPDKHLLFSEGCVELGDHLPAGLWEHGERYGRNIINDLNSGAEGWIDWNLFLDETGGPNHAANYCEAPIMYDRAAKRMIVNPSYRFLKHISPFLKPGSVRLIHHTENMSHMEATAFLTPQDDMILIVQNEGVPTSLVFTVDDRRGELALPAHAIATVIINLSKEGS